MARGTTILLILSAAAVAVVLWLSADVGGETPGERAALAPGPGRDGGALSPARIEPTLVRAPEAGSASDPRAVATAATAPGGGAELTLDVLDATTGRRVPAFFATLLPDGVHTQGRDGVARFTGLRAGTLTIQVQGPEHEPTVASVELPAPGPVQIKLPQRTGLRGVVRFADARPAPDVVLRLEAVPGAGQNVVPDADQEEPMVPSAPVASPTGAPPMGAPPPDEPVATAAKTDADGRYRFAPLPPGRYTVVPEHLGQALPPLGPYVVTAGMTELPELRLDAGARLELEVTDTAGAACGNVLIVVVPTSGAALRRYSASDGTLILEPLVPGRYIVTLPALAGQPEQRRELDLTLGVHRESFRVEPAAPARR